MTVHPASKSTVVKAARHPLNHLVPLENQLLCRSPWLQFLYLKNHFRQPKQIHKDTTLHHPHMLPGPIWFLNCSQRAPFQCLRIHDVAVSLEAGTLLPLVEVGRQWPVAAAVLKCGCRRADLSSKLCGPVSSSERR